VDSPPLPILRWLTFGGVIINDTHAMGAMANIQMAAIEQSCPRG
jgi:hypothetical protein